MSDIIAMRDIEIVTAEIVTIKRQAQQVLITAAIEIGRRLTEAKSMVDHGEWGKYLEERVEYSQSTANNLMRIYKEYGSGQDSLFDSFANSQTFANLNYTQALALLSVPAEDREAFAVENDVANKSTREIQELIRQRDESREALAVAEDAVTDANNEKVAALRRLDAMTARAEEAEAEAERRTKEAAELSQKVIAAKEAEKKAKAQLKEARENPVVSDDQMAKIRKEAETAAAVQAAEKADREAHKLQKKLDAALAEAKKANEEREKALLDAEDARRQVAEAKASARLDNPDAAVFKSLWEQVQEIFNRMNGVRLKIRQTDPGMATALATGIKAMLSQWEAQLE